MTDRSKQKSGNQFKAKVPVCYSCPIVVIVSISVLRCPSTAHLCSPLTSGTMLSLCLVPHLQAPDYCPVPKTSLLTTASCDWATETIWSVH